MFVHPFRYLASLYKDMYICGVSHQTKNGMHWFVRNDFFDRLHTWIYYMCSCMIDLNMFMEHFRCMNAKMLYTYIYSLNEYLDEYKRQTNSHIKSHLITMKMSFIHIWIGCSNSNRLKVNLSNLDLINKFKKCNNCFITFLLLYLHIHITFYEENVVNKDRKYLLAPP